MENNEKEKLKKSRKTALFLTLVTSLIITTINFTILKITADPQTQLIALVISTILIVVVIIIIGRFRNSKLRQSE